MRKFTSPDDRITMLLCDAGTVILDRDSPVFTVALDGQHFDRAQLVELVEALQVVVELS